MLHLSTCPAAASQVSQFDVAVCMSVDRAGVLSNRTPITLLVVHCRRPPVSADGISPACNSCRDLSFRNVYEIATMSQKTAYQFLVISLVS